MRNTLALLLILLFTMPACTGQKSNVPKPTGWVNDFERVFTPGEIERIEVIVQQTMAHANKDTSGTGLQLAIITVSDSMMGPYDDILPFAVELSNKWGVGDKKKNNGVSIVFCKARHKVAIVTGLGMDKILPDGLCKRIIDAQITPALKRGDYVNGILAAIEQIDRIITEANPQH